MRPLLVRTVLFLALAWTVGLASCTGNSPSGQPADRADSAALQGWQDKGGLDALNTRIQADPGDAAAYHDRAQIYLRAGKMNEALRDIGRALEIRPDAPAFLITLSDIYFGLQQPQKTRETLLKVLDLDPMNTNAMLKLAEFSLYHRDYAGVESYAQRALNVDPNLAQAYFILGFASKEKGDTTQAIRFFMQTADRDPQYFEAFMQLGILHAALRDPLAEKYYERALSLQPESVEVLYNMGLYYQENEFYNEALETYHRIILLEPGFRLAYYNLGYIHMVYLGVYQEAVKYFTQALEVDPGYVEALYNRGYAYELMGDVLNARADYQKALQIRPNYPMAVSGLNRLDELDRPGGGNMP